MPDARKRLAHAFRGAVADDLRELGLELDLLQVALGKRKRRKTLTVGEAAELVKWETLRGTL